MSAVGEFAERKDRPAYVRFERLAEEDIPASRAAGKFVAKDVDYVLITPPYSKDIFKQKVKDWLPQLDRDQSGGRIPQQWVDLYKDAYKRWQNGQEMPLNGSPIKGWGVISPAQQETLLRMNILTVEDLAGVNDEGVRRIGMGAVELKNKAQAWLAQLGDKGPLTMKMAALEQENGQLRGEVATLSRQVHELMTAHRANVQAPQQAAAEILDDTPTPRVQRQRSGKQAEM